MLLVNYENPWTKSQGARASYFPGANFINDFFHHNQNLMGNWNSLTPLLGIISIQNFAHTTTAQLSCHVQHFIAITSILIGWKPNEISIKSVLWWKNHLWNSPHVWLYSVIAWVLCALPAHNAIWKHGMMQIIWWKHWRNTGNSTIFCW